MRQVTHPERLFIQIHDVDEKTLGFSFNDDETNPEALDPNVFDEDTLFRITRMLANMFRCIELHRQDGTRLKSLDE